MVFSMISEQISESLYVMDIRDNYIIGMISSFFLVLQTTSRRYLIKNVPLQFPSPRDINPVWTELKTSFPTL